MVDVVLGVLQEALVDFLVHPMVASAFDHVLNPIRYSMVDTEVDPVIDFLVQPVVVPAVDPGREPSKSYTL